MVTSRITTRHSQIRCCLDYLGTSCKRRDSTNCKPFACQSYILTARSPSRQTWPPLLDRCPDFTPQQHTQESCTMGHVRLTLRTGAEKGKSTPGVPPPPPQSAFRGSRQKDTKKKFDLPRQLAGRQHLLIPHDGRCVRKNTSLHEIS